MKRIREKVPFKRLSLHPDTGSEFINWFLKKWCDEEKIELTRSRPNHKNDNAFMEQKNIHVIRRFLGYVRFNYLEVVPVMNIFYNYLEIYLNHFVASRKYLKKVRTESKYRRKCDKGKMAYQRVLEHPNIDNAVKEKLQKEHGKLNPLLLKREVDKLIEEILKIQKTTIIPELNSKKSRFLGSSF